MNRGFHRTVVLLTSVLLTGMGGAQETDLNQRLEKLQIKLDHMARRSNQPGTGGTNVVGVRGANQAKSSQALYWKGRRKKNAAPAEEIKALRAAVHQAQAGKKAEAVASLKVFKQKYPKSTLLADADETLRLLGEPGTTPNTESAK